MLFGSFEFVSVLLVFAHYITFDAISCRVVSAVVRFGSSLSSASVALSLPSSFGSLLWALLPVFVPLLIPGMFCKKRNEKFFR